MPGNQCGAAGRRRSSGCRRRWAPQTRSAIQGSRRLRSTSCDVHRSSSSSHNNVPASWNIMPLCGTRRFHHRVGLSLLSPSRPKTRMWGFVVSHRYLASWLTDGAHANALASRLWAQQQRSHWAADRFPQYRKDLTSAYVVAGCFSTDTAPVIWGMGEPCDLEHFVKWVSSETLIFVPLNEVSPLPTYK